MKGSVDPILAYKVMVKPSIMSCLYCNLQPSLITNTSMLNVAVFLPPWSTVMMANTGDGRCIRIRLVAHKMFVQDFLWLKLPSLNPLEHMILPITARSWYCTPKCVFSVTLGELWLASLNTAFHWVLTPTSTQYSWITKRHSLSAHRFSPPQ